MTWFDALRDIAAYIGVFVVILVVVVAISIWNDERKAKKMERARRERNWDFQETRIDRLAEQVRERSARIAELEQVTGANAVRLDRLIREFLHAQLEHEETHDALEKQASLLGYIKPYGDRIEALEDQVVALEDKQTETVQWQSFTDEQLENIDSVLREQDHNIEVLEAEMGLKGKKEEAA